MGTEVWLEGPDDVVEDHRHEDHRHDPHVAADSAEGDVALVSAHGAPWPARASASHGLFTAPTFDA